MYYQKPTWTKDVFRQYYQGAEMQFELPLTKLAIMVLMMVFVKLTFGSMIAILVYLVISFSYQTIIAKICGVIVMPSMD
jgi:hypothetical protein